MLIPELKKINIKNEDKYAKNILNEFIEDFSKWIKKIINKYEINNFCIGGGLSNYYKFYIDEIRKKLPECNIYIAKYKYDSGIIGVAYQSYRCEFFIYVVAYQSSSCKYVKKLCDFN